MSLHDLRKIITLKNVDFWTIMYSATTSDTSGHILSVYLNHSTFILKKHL